VTYELSCKSEKNNTSDDAGDSEQSVRKFAAKAWTGNAKGQVCPMAPLRRTRK
jgi:hypothetical protein